MNKPIYIGQAILDISKYVMYNFYYKVMKPNLRDLTLNYMDTDSFIFETSTDIFEFIRENPRYFDTSNYDKDNCFGIKPQNKKVIGLFKDELAGKPMTEFVGLRSKLYAYKYDTRTVTKAKGINKSGMRSINFEHYFGCLNNIRKKILVKQTTFRSFKHKVSTIEMNKVALCGTDDKRKTVEGSDLTLAWGHYCLGMADP